MAMDDMSFEFLKVVVSVCTALITMWLLPYLDTLRKNKRWNRVINMVNVAVRAAEQVITDPKSGKIKKERVTLFIKPWLEKFNVDISEKEIDELIEAAVYQMNHPAQELQGGDE